MKADSALGLPAAAFPETCLSIPGVRCAACIEKIESGLARVPGIVSARVNFTAKRVSITHDAMLKLPDLQTALRSLGFDNHATASDFARAVRKDSADLLKSLAVAGFAAMNIMLLSVSVWSGATGLARDLFHWLSAAIALPAIAYSGRPFFRSAWQALRRGRTNMDVPISIGVTLAAALSLFETIVHGAHAYFDGAVMLLFFLLAGRALDSIMRDRARDGVAALAKQMARGALVIEKDGRSKWYDLEDLEAGMTILISAGERVAADGIIVSGSSALDISLLTGEAQPVPVAIGDAVNAGVLNLVHPLQVRITAIGQGTVAAEIARLMEEATQARSAYMRVADRAARLYAPAVHTLALLSFAGWIVAGAGWHQALLIAVAVLIITCPCALGLAVPAAQIVSVGALMRHGILVKDGSALERLAEADMAIFDKTGTLTLGTPRPVGLGLLDSDRKAILLGLSRQSRHPFSEAIRSELEGSAVAAAPIESVVETPGVGVTGRLGGKVVGLGRSLRPNSGPGQSATLSIEGEADTVIRFEDSMRPDARRTIDALGKVGIPAMIASGDFHDGVAPYARALHLTAVTGLLPAEKLAIVERNARAGRKVLMVGDGLNDGPSLAAGHVSMAPASANDVSQSAADIVFMGGSLFPVFEAVSVARETQKVVRQNFALAIVYNALAVPLAVVGWVTPLIAAAAMSGSSLLVVANALRLKRVLR